MPELPNPPLPEILLAVLCLALLVGVIYESYKSRKMRRFILSRRCEYCRNFYLVIESDADRCGAFCSARCEEAAIPSVPLVGDHPFESLRDPDPSNPSGSPRATSKGERKSKGEHSRRGS